MIAVGAYLRNGVPDEAPPLLEHLQFEHRTAMAARLLTPRGHAAYARRNVVMRDGRVVSDRPVTQRTIATEELEKLGTEIEETMVSGTGEHTV